MDTYSSIGTRYVKMILIWSEGVLSSFANLNERALIRVDLINTSSMCRLNVIFESKIMPRSFNSSLFSIISAFIYSNAN